MSTELSYVLDDFLRMEIPSEIDGDLIMALLEESQAEEEAAGDDRLGCVMRALEAEINHVVGNGDNGSIVSNEVNSESCGMDDIFVGDVSSDGCSLSWMEMGPYESSSDHDIGEWYLDACMDDGGMVDHLGDQRVSSSSSLFYGEGSTEPVYYSPLWQ